ncbi:MAG: protein O-mannosyl-transferase [Verrucomicrobiota bacterium]
MEAAPTPAVTSPVAAERSRLARWGKCFRRTWVQACALALLGFVVRFPALQGELIWDDEYLVRENPMTRSPMLVIETFRHHLFLDSSSAHYRPVQNISYCLDYLVWKGDIYGYHLTNVFLHVASAVLLFFLLRRILPPLLRQRKHSGDGAGSAGLAGAFWIALLWAVHPAHSAAVDYISGRADSLAAFFACAAWLLYLRGRGVTRRPIRAGLYALGCLCGLLALCSRESALIWLAVFLLHLFAFAAETPRRKWAIVAACLCVVAGYLALRALPEARQSNPATAGSPAVVRATLMMRALGDYGRLLIYPANLHMDRTVVSPAELLGNAGWRTAVRAEYLSFFGLIVVSALLFGACWKGSARAIRAFGAGWFVIAFLPISNLVELNATVAEHWLYLPSMGLLIFGYGCAAELRKSRWAFAALVLPLAVAVLATRSYVRSEDWLNSETFYRNSLASGASKPRIALNLGLVLTAKGKYAEAEPLLRRVVAIEPDYPIAINALAHLLYREGKMEEANKYFAESAKAAARTRTEYPRTWIAALNVAHLRFAEKDVTGALETVERGVRDYPDTWELISFESELLRELHGPQAALPVVQGFAKRHWWHAPAAVALGKLFSEAGNVVEAEAAFRHASRLDIYGVEALNLLALMEVRHNHLEAAFATQGRAVSRQPDQPRQYLLLSDILEKMGRTAEAQAALAQVSQLSSLAGVEQRVN